MNLNDLAVAISKVEAGKKGVSIAQIKEVLSCLGFVLAHETMDTVIKVQAALLKAGAKRE